MWWTGGLAIFHFLFIHFLYANAFISCVPMHILCVCVYHIRQFGPSLVRACPLSAATACTRVTTHPYPISAGSCRVWLRGAKIHTIELGSHAG